MFSSILKSFQKEEEKVVKQTNDLEEDGFLVVGQTRSEETTIVASNFNGNIDRPPSYMEVSEDKDIPLTRSQDTSKHIDNHPLQDVPFSINPQLQLMWGVGQTSLPFTRLYDPSKYEYDFSLEYSILNSNLS